MRAIYRKSTYIGITVLLLGTQNLHAEEATFHKAAKMRSYMPDSVVDEAYENGRKVGVVTGVLSKNIVYTTYKTSHDAGYTSGKIAKKLWRKLWN